MDLQFDLIFYGVEREGRWDWGLRGVRILGFGKYWEVQIHYASRESRLSTRSRILVIASCWWIASVSSDCVCIQAVQ